jgi:phosphoglycolate phosphatase
MVKLVLFDIDGTLIRTHGAGVRAFGMALAAQFGVPDDTSAVSFPGRTDPGLAREFFTLHGIEPSAENFQLFFDCYVHCLDHLMARCTGAACPGVVRLMGELRALRTPPTLGLLTGNIRLGAEIKLRQFGLWEWFETGAFGDDHENRDKVAAIARKRGSRLLRQELRGDEIIVVGDTPLDIKCGRAIGAKVLAVATGGATAAELKAHSPDWLAPDLERVSAEDLCAP